jgi:ZIP family zinc transporter
MPLDPASLIWVGSLAGLIAGLATGLGAGAMLSVISDEILPESDREGQGLAPTVGMVFGFLLMMMILDTAFA